MQENSKIADDMETEKSALNIADSALGSLTKNLHRMKEVAQQLHDEGINWLDRIKKDDHSVLHSDTPFIICASIYVCEKSIFLFQVLIFCCIINDFF